MSKQVGPAAFMELAAPSADFSFSSCAWASVFIRRIQMQVSVSRQPRATSRGATVSLLRGGGDAPALHRPFRLPHRCGGGAVAGTTQPPAPPQGRLQRRPWLLSVNLSALFLVVWVRPKHVSPPAICSQFRILYRLLPPNSQSNPPSTS